MEDGRWGIGDGRWGIGDGRWGIGMGDEGCEMKKRMMGVLYSRACGVDIPPYCGR